MKFTTKIARRGCARSRNAPGSAAFLEESLRATVGRAATAKLEAAMAAILLVRLR